MFCRVARLLCLRRISRCSFLFVVRGSVFGFPCSVFGVRCSVFCVLCSVFCVWCSLFVVCCSVFRVSCSGFRVRCLLFVSIVPSFPRSFVLSLSQSFVPLFCRSIILSSPLSTASPGQSSVRSPQSAVSSPQVRGTGYKVRVPSFCRSVVLSFLYYFIHSSPLYTASPGQSHCVFCNLLFLLHLHLNHL